MGVIGIAIATAIASFEEEEQGCAVLSFMCSAAQYAAVLCFAVHGCGVRRIRAGQHSIAGEGLGWAIAMAAAINKKNATPKAAQPTPLQ